MDSVLVGMFDTRTAAEQAQTELLSAGFAPGAVSLTGEDATISTGTLVPVADNETRQTGLQQQHHQGPVSRFFENLFGSDNDGTATHGEASTYREVFRRGGYGVTVQAQSESELDRAQVILNDAGAIDIDTRAETWRQEGWVGAQPMQASQAGSAALGTGMDAGTRIGAGTDSVGLPDEGSRQTLQEVEEELKVGKRTVSRGGVRIYSRLVEVPVQESVMLREEHANVERRIVDRPATEADLSSFKEGSIELRETAEEAVVSKTARVVGEVEISKSATEREETVHDTVRHTEVNVEPIDGGGSRAATTGGGQMAYVEGDDALGTAGSGSVARNPLTGEFGTEEIDPATGARATPRVKGQGI